MTRNFPKLWLPSRPRWIEVYGECPVLVVCEWKPCTEFGFTTPYGCLHGGCNAGRTDFPESLEQKKSYGSAMFLVEPFIIKVMEVLKVKSILLFVV